MLRGLIKLTSKCSKTVVRGLEENTGVRRFSGYYQREPSKIANEDELQKFYDEFEQGPQEQKPKISHRKPLDPKPKKKAYEPQYLPKLKKHGSFEYREVPENYAKLTSLMMSVRSRKRRTDNCKIILEGERLITDAIKSGAVLETVVFTRLYDVDKIPLPDNVEMYKIPYRAIQTWSTLVSPPGMMGFFKLPNTEATEVENPLPLTVICDTVRDPGNMGAILRGAAAVGCSRVITVKGCVDIWDPKVLKTAAGAHFKVPIFPYKQWANVVKLVDPHANYLIADNKSVRSEGEADEESEDEEHVEETEMEEELNETSEDPEPIGDDFKVVDDSMSRKERVNMSKQLAGQIPIVPYYAMQYETNENVIIVGGETEGLSVNALNLVHQRSGLRVNIPMNNDVESLNTGMALGILMFEIKRQILMDQTSKRMNQGADSANEVNEKQL